MKVLFLLVALLFSVGSYAKCRQTIELKKLAASSIPDVGDTEHAEYYFKIYRPDERFAYGDEINAYFPQKKLFQFVEISDPAAIVDLGEVESIEIVLKEGDFFFDDSIARNSVNFIKLSYEEFATGRFRSLNNVLNFSNKGKMEALLIYDVYKECN